MHRSGTSCLTGALERCGVYLGDVRRTGTHNKRGYFEVRQVQQLQDDILEVNMGSWHNPPKNIVVSASHKQALSEIINQLSIHGPFALKDPRSLLIANVWKEIGGKSCQPIGTFRHPMAVAQSLAKRNQLTIEHGLNLWKIYNTELINAHKAFPFPLIHYDLSKKTSYTRTIVHLARTLNLKPRKISLFFFISSALEHQRSTALAVPPDCQEIYSYLIQNQFLGR